MLLWLQPASAQTNKLGGWVIVNLKYHLNPQLVLYAEVQTRSQRLSHDFYFDEFKGGIVYNFPKRLSVAFGAGNSETYPFPGNFKGPATVKEFNMWEQLVLNNNIERLKIEHRYTIEQRWINGNYRNRFRYRLNAVVPLNHPTVVPHTLFVTVSNEVYFGSKLPYFERNRFFAGMGFQFSPLIAVQSGFIRQFDYRAASSSSGKNFIQTSLLFSANRSVSRRERHPSTID